MKNISTFEKEKIMQILQCNEKELNLLANDTISLFKGEDSFYNLFLRILQQGHNIREATFSAIILGERLGYKKAKIEMEEEIKETLYRAFKNNQ